jgi:NAD-dependent dihydropyrimidine dehydrogenase PreA subunit
MMLKDKVAVIYGAAGAVGSTAAHAFAREGASVFLTGRSTSKLNKVAEEISSAGLSPEVAIGVHGTMVADDWDSCYADGSCIEVCPVKLYQWARTDNEIPAVQMANITSPGNGSTDKEGRVDYTDKSDPIREQDCIWCMACVAVCPPQAIKVDQSNMEYHQVADQTFREVTPY